MKSSLKKLRGLATPHNNDSNDKRGLSTSRRPAQLDELAQASQDMQDMKDCYDSLISAAAATANSAYEFSEALEEMGTCLLEKTALNDDEESGKVLLMLGKVQFELQKLVNNYRLHILQTIQTPSESLLNELKTVEDMKRQCDDKREILEHMLDSQKTKGKSREVIPRKQLQEAQQEYDEEAALFVFRLKSLKQGQSRSLLTQAARHHAAQLCFFRKGNKSLEAIEPHVKFVAEQQHIDYQFSGLEDDVSEDDNDQRGGSNDGELSFDCGQNEDHFDAALKSRNSMELDHTDIISAPVSDSLTTEEISEKGLEYFPHARRAGPASYSAPILPDKKFDPTERLKEMRKFRAYVLPTPVESRSRSLVSSDTSFKTMLLNTTGLSQPGPVQSLKPQSILKESHTGREATSMVPSFTEGSFSASEKKRHAYSGPLMSKEWLNKTGSSWEYPPGISVMPSHAPLPRPSKSPKISPSTSPPPASSPMISELHELPRPPLNAIRPAGRHNFVGFSGPLMSRDPDRSSVSNRPSHSYQTASPLPVPPITMARSLSILSSDQAAQSTSIVLLPDVHKADTNQNVASSPVTPIALTNNQL